MRCGGRSPSPARDASAIFGEIRWLGDPSAKSRVQEETADTVVPNVSATFGYSSAGGSQQSEVPPDSLSVAAGETKRMVFDLCARECLASHGAATIRGFFNARILPVERCRSRTKLLRARFIKRRHSATLGELSITKLVGATAFT